MQAEDYDWRIRLQVAEEHIERAQKRVDDYMATEPYRVEITPEVLATRGLLRTYDVVFRANIESQPPRRLAHDVGDTIENLRSAIEILVFALAEQHSGRLPKTERSVAFPAYSNGADFTARTSKGKLERHSGLWKVRLLHPDAQAAIESLQPYQGTDQVEFDNVAPHLPRAVEEHPLYMLDQMRQQNYHRRPLLAGALGGMPRFGLNNAAGAMVVANPTDRPPPADDSDEIYRARIIELVPNAHVEIVPTLMFDVRFDSGGPGMGLPVMSTLRQIRNHVADVIFPALEVFVRG